MTEGDETNGNPEEQPKDAFDPDRALEACRKLYEPPVRRLTFAERCEIFAFAYNGTPNRYLVSAFGVSAATIANISGCLKYDPQPRRLQYVRDPHPERRKIENPTDLDMPRLVEHDHNSRRNPNRTERYEDVRREFEALGEVEFGRRYVTVDNYRRIAAARRDEIAARRDRKTAKIKAGKSRTPY
jgi:hypothetical protein